MIDIEWLRMERTVQIIVMGTDHHPPDKRELGPSERYFETGKESV